MKLYTVTVDTIDDYGWTLNYKGDGSKDYHTEYAPQRDAATNLILARIGQLEQFGLKDWKNDGKDYAVTAEQLAEIQASGIGLKVIRSQEIATDHEKMLAAFTATGRDPSPPPQEHAYNSLCEVHVTGQALTAYNAIMLMEDACTDALQRNLDEGWRIIAACPQPNGRRPDYVLGRWDSKRSPGGGAERG